MGFRVQSSCRGHEAREHGEIVAGQTGPEETLLVNSSLTEYRMTGQRMGTSWAKCPTRRRRVAPQPITAVRGQNAFVRKSQVRVPEDALSAALDTVAKTRKALGSSLLDMPARCSS
jgi:hypothetical protein